MEYKKVVIDAYKTDIEDISEPLKEYEVLAGGYLREISEPSLLGVRINGKWGWIDNSGKLIIPAEYDHGFGICYNGIIILKKNGKEGGLYRKDLTTAFSFKYDYLGHSYGNTYCAYLGDKCFLVKPGDKVITSKKYLGFKLNYGNRYTDFIRCNFWGQTVKGRIDLETGEEL